MNRNVKSLDDDPVFADEFERRYLDLFWRRQRWQWDNYASGHHRDLDAVDGEIYKLVTSYREKCHSSGRRGDVLDSIVNRDLVDKHPDVARLRNRLDDRRNYEAFAK